MTNKPVCPNCNHSLETEPKRKSKCPHCAELIFVRQGKLVTEDEARIIDWLKFLEQFEITKEIFDQERDKLSDEFKTRASVHDTVWRILNSWVAKHPLEWSNQFAYYEMARLLYQEGKDGKSMIEAALRAQLQFYISKNIKKVVIECYGGEPDYSTCPNCASLHGRIFKITDALDMMPIPRNCAHETGCRCSYQSVTSD